MTEKASVKKLGIPDWVMRGILTKLGDSFDKLTGRKWAPTSSLAASVLIEKIKKLLDAEARDIPGKGKVVPHNIKLKMQWNKFSEDAEEGLRTLEVELLTAAVDHINDSLYYTYAPVTLEVKPDYFIEGVKLTVSFEEFEQDDGGVEMNVTLPAANLSNVLDQPDSGIAASETYIFHYKINGEPKEKRLEFTSGKPQPVGRIGANALVLDDPSVSKSHASFALSEDGSLSVADTGSTNGTFINDERIAYGKAVRLVDGDKVKFGTVEVTFHHVPRPAVTSPESMSGEAVDDTVSIDGFEFKRRVSPEPSPGAAGSDPHSDTSPAISMPRSPIPGIVPDDTLRMDDQETLDMPQDEPSQPDGPKK